MILFICSKFFFAVWQEVVMKLVSGKYFEFLIMVPEILLIIMLNKAFYVTYSTIAQVHLF